MRKETFEAGMWRTGLLNLFLLFSVGICKSSTSIPTTHKEMRPYAQRLRSERARLQLAQAELAAAGSVSKTTQVGYENDAHVPDLEYVDEVAGLGVDKIFMCTGTPKIKFVAKEFDWELHRDITQAIFEWARQREVEIPPTKLSDLIHLLYEEFVATRTIEPSVLARALRLVA